MCVHGNSRKSDSLLKTLRTRFQQENFSKLLPTESLRTQELENVVNLGDRASKLQGLKVRSYAKNRKLFGRSKYGQVGCP